MIKLKIFVIFLSVIALPTGCVNNNQSSLPSYISNNLGDKLFSRTDHITCYSAVHNFSKSSFEKIKNNLSNNGGWEQTPVNKAIIDGMSVESKILFGGAQCGNGLEKYEESFFNSIDNKGSYYIYWADTFILINTHESILYIVSYS